MSNILDDTHNLLSSNRKIMSAINHKYRLQSKIAAKAIDLGIKKKLNNKSLSSSTLTTSTDNNPTKSASLDHNNNEEEIQSWMVATDFEGARTRYITSIEDNKNNNIKSARSNPQEGAKAWLTIHEFMTTGGIKHYDNEDNSVKSAAKRDPTAYLTINEYLDYKY